MLRFMLLVRYFFLPLVFVILFEINTILGYVGFAIALAGVLYQGWRLSGRARPTPKQAAAREKQRLMEHYYYHCSRNPEAFAKLRADNFRNHRN